MTGLPGGRATDPRGKSHGLVMSMKRKSRKNKENRKQELLRAIIKEFIKTARPVGSVYLAAEHRLDISAPTVRQAMAELEAEGYLTHPHTSAGRVPTDKGYRFYIESALFISSVDITSEEEKLRGLYEKHFWEIEALMTSVAKTLSSLSGWTGFIFAPAFDQVPLHHVELIALDPHRLLVVFVGESGLVKYRQVIVDEGYSQDYLSVLTSIINDALSAKPLSEVPKTVLTIVEKTLEGKDVLRVARDIVTQAFEVTDESEFYVDGLKNILCAVDFRQSDQLFSLINLFDNKRNLGSLIAGEIEEAAREQLFGGSGIGIRVGEENRVSELKNFSLVFTAYEINGRPACFLGVLGPKRMDYERVINLVTSLGKIVSRVFTHLPSDKVAYERHHVMLPAVRRGYQIGFPRLWTLPKPQLHRNGGDEDDEGDLFHS